VIVEADEGDAGKHWVVYPFLKAVLTGFQPFPEWTRVAPFRAGAFRDKSLTERGHFPRRRAKDGRGPLS
jgi:hypothetical protein